MIFEWYGNIMYRFRVWFLVFGLVCMVAAGFYAGGIYGSLSQSGFSVPDSQSQIADSLVNQRFGGNRDSLVVLFSSPSLTVHDAAYRQTAQALLERLTRQPTVHDTQSYFSTGDSRFVSRDGHKVYALVALKGNDDQQAAAVQQLGPQLKNPVLTVRLGGSAAVNAESTTYVRQDLSRAELVTFPITALLLVVIFGSLAAAALPLAVGVYGIIGALTITRLVAIATPMSVYVLNLIMLLGLGLAIDYSLFMVSRFREELRSNKHDVQRALVCTIDTAGRTVLFSALTVLISLAGLVVFPLDFLRSMGVGGAAAVLVALLGALMFLPAIMAVLGPKVDALHVAHMLPEQARTRVNPHGIWSRLCHFAMRRPFVTIVLTLGVILLAGVPFLHIHFTNPDFTILPQSSAARQVGESLQHDFANGDQTPIQVVVKAAGVPTDPAELRTLYAYVQQLKKLPNVASVDSLVSLPGVQTVADYIQLYTGPPTSKTQVADAQFVTGSYTVIDINPTTTTYAPATKHLVELARQVPVHGVSRWVGGQTADLVDLLATVRHYGLYALIIVLAAILVLFFLMLGSVVIPLKTMVLNVLSLSASFGALVWVFQDGHLASWLGITPVAGIDATQPVIIFALAFGLSMDYAIFLFSRVKEHFDEQADIEKAVAWGVQKTGHIITSAAALLLVVIGAFAAGRIVVMKEVAYGLIVAVLVDVFVVRLLLVPASMRLLGKYNWWAPRPLKKLHDKLGIREAG